MRIIVVLQSVGLSVLLNGCGAAVAPAPDGPVELKPGLYKVTMGGNLAGMTVPGAESAPDAPICVQSDEIAAFPHRVALNYLAGTPGCTESSTETKDNMFSGKFICPVDPNAMQGTRDIEYVGKVAADSIAIESKMTLTGAPIEGPDAATINQGKVALQALTFTLRADRVGDCP
jgi:hypothetical protein